MPHFFAIGIYRLSDYTIAKIPILPVSKSVDRTKIHIIAWMLLLIPTIICVYIFNYGGLMYLIPSLIALLWWVYITFKGFKSMDATLWAKKVFLFSIVVICIFSVSLILDSIITNIKV
jgi:protoheme IX farnesyltransferase